MQLENQGFMPGCSNPNGTGKQVLAAERTMPAALSFDSELESEVSQEDPSLRSTVQALTTQVSQMSKVLFNLVQDKSSADNVPFEGFSNIPPSILAAGTLPPPTSLPLPHPVTLPGFDLYHACNIKKYEATKNDKLTLKVGQELLAYSRLIMTPMQWEVLCQEIGGVSTGSRD